MSHMLENWIEHKVPVSILNQYWWSGNDHKDFRAIIEAIDRGGGQTCDVSNILIQLDKAGFKIVKK